MAKRHHAMHNPPHHGKMHESHPLHTSKKSTHMDDHELDATGLPAKTFIKDIHVPKGGFDYHYKSSIGDIDAYTESDIAKLDIKPRKV